MPCLGAKATSYPWRAPHLQMKLEIVVASDVDRVVYIEDAKAAQELQAGGVQLVSKDCKHEFAVVRVCHPLE